MVTPAWGAPGPLPETHMSVAWSFGSSGGRLWVGPDKTPRPLNFTTPTTTYGVVVGGKAPQPPSGYALWIVKRADNYLRDYLTSFRAP